MEGGDFRQATIPCASEKWLCLFWLFLFFICKRVSQQPLNMSSNQSIQDSLAKKDDMYYCTFSRFASVSVIVKQWYFIYVTMHIHRTISDDDDDGDDGDDDYDDDDDDDDDADDHDHDNDHDND